MNLYNSSRSTKLLALTILCNGFISFVFAQTSLGIPDTPTNANYVEDDLLTSGLLSNVGLREGGVNLFTGKVQLSLDIESLNLSYNGKVKRILSTPNDIIQSSAVGVGWTLELGYIKANKNNTVEITDDEYNYVTGDGFSSELIHDTLDYFFPKDYKFWKIRRVIQENQDNGLFDIIGWEVLKEDGTKFVYGDFQLGFGAKKANRNYLCWGNWIGNGDTTGFSHTAYRWDLSAIVNIYGDTVQSIFYQQEQEGLGIGLDEKYTKASYPQRVLNPRTGIELLFELGDRNILEWKDNYPFNETNGKEVATGDGFVENYETQYISKINKINNAQLIKTYKFEYDSVEAGFTGENRYKRFLIGIKEFNALEEPLPGHKFEYIGINDGTNCNAGACDSLNQGGLIKIIYPTGGSSGFTYEYTDVGLSFKGNSDDLSDLNSSDGTIDGVRLLMNSKFLINNEHLIVEDRTSVIEFGIVRAWHWNGNEWQDQNTLLAHGQVGTSQSYLMDLSGNKLITISRGYDGYDHPDKFGKVQIWHWTGERWKEQDNFANFRYYAWYLQDGTSHYFGYPQVDINSNHIAMVGPINSENPDSLFSGEGKFYKIESMHWNGNGWEALNALPGASTFETNYIEDLANCQLQSTENHIVVATLNGIGNNGSLIAWNWNGINWSEPQTLLDKKIFMDTPHHKPNIKLYDNLLVVFYQPETISNLATIKTWFWNGEKWNEIQLYIDADYTFVMADYSPPRVYLVNNKLAIFSADGRLRAWIWNGNSWIPQGYNGSPIVGQFNYMTVQIDNGNYWPLNKMQMNSE